MKHLLILILFTFATTALFAEDDWQILFDGSGLEGWKSNDEKPDVFSVTDAGELRVSGGRAHLFWMGTEEIPDSFTDFEIQMKVKTTPGANSGFFFHTEFQKRGWPNKGLEAQVNSTHKDERKTGSIYAIQDVLNDAPSTDGQWFDYEIRVKGKRVTVFVNGKVVNDYTQATPAVTPKKRPNVRLGKGTFAIRGHDPKSTVFYKEIRVRVGE